jgi:tetratricopeptide (TPR) repeat protein
MSKRLAMLESMTAKGATDPFAWYGLAMEYKNLGRLEEAVGAFEKLREIDSGYLAGYHMAGLLLIELGRPEQAKTWLEQGLAIAEAKGDMKTKGEIQAALDEVDL